MTENANPTYKVNVTCNCGGYPQVVGEAASAHAKQQMSEMTVLDGERFTVLETLRYTFRSFSWDDETYDFHVVVDHELKQCFVVVLLVREESEEAGE
jgi:hypothetical protein